MVKQVEENESKKRNRHHARSCGLTLRRLVFGMAPAANATMPNAEAISATVHEVPAKHAG